MSSYELHLATSAPTLTAVVRYLRFAPLAVSSLVLAGVSALPAAPADAATVAPDGVSSTAFLCWGYTGCARAGMGNAGYSAVSGTMYWLMYGGHNCTNYAAYRMVHSGLPNRRPWTGNGNAMYWGTSMSRITDGTPAVGAVAWWRAYKSPAGSAGHVAYVERIVDADTIVVSQDSWGGDFSWKRITRSGGQWPSGFVHFNDLAQRNTAAPTITGTPQVGATLSATPGSWALPGATYRYQWRADGANIAGATGSTLALTQSLVGKAVSVQVTALTTGYPNAPAVSAATAAVRSSTVLNTNPPAISGTAAVGSTLTAVPGTWSPSGSVTTYQWRSGGRALPGQTGRTLAIGPDLAGKRVLVMVTARSAGLDPLALRAPTTDVIAPGTITTSTPPVITGTPRPGQVLTLTQGTTAPADAVTTTQWLRDGVPVAGATAPTYRLGSADLGHRVSAQVSATRPGYEPLQLSTPPTATVRALPTLKVTAVPGHQSLQLTVAVTAPGAGPVDGLVGVRLNGVRLRVLAVHGGTGTVSLTKLPVGTQKFQLHLRRTDTVDLTDVWQTVRIR